MNTINSSVRFFISLGKTQTILSNRFDRSLNGLGFNEFLILFYLDQAEDNKLKRVELADKIGMTASGVTRLLLPMEKVHLINSGPVETDARVRYVNITKAGREKMTEAIERLELLAEDVIPKDKVKDLDGISELLITIGGKTLMS